MSKKINILNTDGTYCFEDYTVILSTRSHKHLDKIANVKPESITYKANMNAADEFSCEVHKEIKGHVEELWDKIVDLKLIYIPELNEYFEIRVPVNDSVDTIKTLTCTSQCEAELSQTILYDIEINTEKDIERDDYDINFPTIFYRNPDDVGAYQDIWDKDVKNECKYIVFVKNEDGSSSTTIDEVATLQRRKNVIKNASLLHRIFDKVPHYSIKYVDDTLKNIQREYSINGTSVYDFLTRDCAEQTECLFLFNSIDRSVSVYDLDTNCLNSECGYRGDFTDVCPKCGCTHLLSGYGEDTTVYIDKDNLTESVSYETSVDDIKNCFKLTAGDDLMTATVRQLNQNGSSYIYYISEEQKEDMSDELVSAINAYDEKYNSYTPEYETLVEQYYDVVDDIVYYTSGMMPGDSTEDSGDDSNNTESLATQEAAKLTVENLQQTALSSITKNTACSTANSALKLYARLFVRTGYVKVEIDETKANSFVYKGKVGDFNYGTWTGTFKVTNYSDTEDIAYVSLSFDINDNYEEFIKQKVMKEMLEKDDDGDMFDVLSIDVSTTEGQNKFKDAITLYCKNRLVSFQDAVTSAINMIATYKDTQPEFYEEFNIQYQFMLEALNSELSVRQATIDNLNTVLETVSSRISEIQNLLNFETNLGKELYDEFCAYRREQEYSNSNFITDGLDNNEIIKRAKEFIELAKKELVKSATRQHTLSSSLNNLFADPTFEPLKDKVALGNWIRLGVDGNVYRLRLISYQINRSEMSKIPVEFSDATRTLDGYNDIKNIITSAQSMATSYGYVSKQADSGYEAQKEISNLRKDGLNSANIRIMNNTKEEVTVDNDGILARSYDDIEDDYDKEQFRITHNIMCFTDDAWRTSKTAIGKINYVLDGIKHEKYGAIADTMIAGTMISGDIYSDNYSSTNKKGAHIDLANGDFTLADGKLNYDSDKNVLSLSGVTLDWNTSNAPAIADINGLSKQIDTFTKDITEIKQELDDEVDTYYLSGIPTLENAPAKDWTTEEYKNHTGDLYLDVDSGYSYRFLLDEETGLYNWKEMSDSAATKALEIASKAQDTADGKRRIFYHVLPNRPNPPYDIGDLWVQGEDGDIYVCTDAKVSGEAYAESDFIIASKYTDDTYAKSIISDMADDLKISPSEKQQLISNLKVINEEYASLVYKAKEYSLTTDSAYVNYVTAYSVLKSYISNYKLTEDLDKTTDVTSEFSTDINNYYSTKEILQNKITDIDNTARKNADEAIKKAKEAVEDASSALDISSALKSYEETTILYAKSTDGQTPPESGWTATIPTIAEGEYLWIKTVITYKDNLGGVSYSNPSYSVAYNGTNGENGKNGTSVTISSTSVTYQISSSGTVTPSGTWSNTVQSPTASSPYLWTRTIVKYSDGNTTTSYSVSKNGKEIKSVVTQYCYSVSQTAFSQASGYSWSEKCPDWAEEKDTPLYIWQRDYITFTNGSTSNSDPVYNNMLKGAINYSKSNIKNLDDKVTNYLTAGGKTTISDDYVLSPYIGGGYINVTGSKARVIIDPSNVSETGYVFAGFNTSTSTTTPIFGIDRSGNGIFGGKLMAATGTFAGSLSAATGSFSGEVTASSGKIGGWKINSNDLINYYNGASDTTHFVKMANATNVNKDFLVVRDGDDYPFFVRGDGTVHAERGTISGWTLNDSKLTATNSSGIVTVVQSGGTWAFATGGTSHASYSDCPFRVDHAGNMYAEKGNIAGWKMIKGYIYNGINIGTSGSCGMSAGASNGGSDDRIFWAGDGAFKVAYDGSVYATKATITGKLTTSVGSSIGSFTTDNNSLFSGSWGSSTPKVFMCSGTNGTYTLGGTTTNGWCFGAGSNFGVTIDGKLYCSGGKIGGFNIGSGSLGGYGSTGIGLYLFPHGATVGNRSDVMIAFYKNSRPYKAITLEGNIVSL